MNTKSIDNPYTLAFGTEPQKSLINRDMQTQEIIGGFLSSDPTYRVCMLTGIRGSGKTVCLSMIANEMESNHGWLVINLNPDLDLLKSLAAELCNRKKSLKIFKEANINLSLFGIGIGVEINKEPAITDVVVVLRNMLKELTNKGIKLLITIDEVKVNDHMRKFTSQVQIYMREKLNIFILMSGLYNNIEKLQNDESLTFLQRAPKIILEPLNISLMKESYIENLSISEDEALLLAKETKGYAFAYQLFGYLYWKHNGDKTKVLKAFDADIEDYSYNKIWEECSRREKDFLLSMDSEPTKLAKIANGKIKDNSLSTYRRRLIKAGIIVSPSYGEVEFALPRFKEYLEKVR